MKEIARLVTRGDEKGVCDFAIFITFKENNLKPNKVYEIVEVLDKFIITEIGIKI